ncbi:MAG TPA: anti-sigma factor [Solirubrobacteraceae bacterium]|jgi:anti-sigma-K factor RskA|nr:anti-sigma factor [Solirubrobacteraceae bacterium]
MSGEEFMSGTHDCGGDAAAYVLGALEPHEAEAFAAHLAECAVCRDDVEALGGVVQALPMAAVQYRAPRSLRRRVLRQVRGEPRLVTGPRTERWRPALASRLGLTSALAACAVAAAAVVTRLELSSGGAGTVVQAHVSGVGGSAQLRVTDGHAELVVRHLTPPAHGHVYEVWLQSGSSAPVPASVLFGVSSAGDADVGLPTNLHGVGSVLVTSEPLGGTKTPTSTPVITARVD